MSDVRFLSIRQLQGRWPYSRTTILRLLAAGRLRGMQAGRKWAISLESIEEVEAQAQAPRTRRKPPRALTPQVCAPDDADLNWGVLDRFRRSS